jgi:hypothetical protein
MKTKIASTIAAVIGSLCFAFAIFAHWQAMSVMSATPVVALRSFDDRFYMWPIYAGIAFWGLAAFGFIWRSKHRHDHAA